MADTDTVCSRMSESLTECLGVLTHSINTGNWHQARTTAGQICYLSMEPELYTCNLDSKQQLKSIIHMLIESGKKVTKVMDYKSSGSIYTQVMSLVASVIDVDGDLVDALCEAYTCQVQNLLYCQKLEEAEAFLLTWGELLESCVSEKTNAALCLAHLDLGLEFFVKTMVASAIDQLQDAEKYLKWLPHLIGTSTEAKLRTSLGCCYLLNGKRVESIEMLGPARKLWKNLGWPLEETNFILSSLKHYAEAQLQLKQLEKTENFVDVTDDLIRLHPVIYKCTKSMKCADIFTYLGINAFNTENEKRAITYFLRALDLYKQLAPSDRNTEEQAEILRLLRFIGVACYNTREFEQACAIYHERLDLLESSTTMDMHRLSQVADCYASLGFTYSRLRNFDKMLHFYERALELESRLTSEDLQLIETNIGSLYHVRAVRLEHAGQREQSLQFYAQAESAFTKALRYSWKSFPFINYGYYLYFRHQYSQSLIFLQQGYLNSVVDKDTVEFDHTEDPILIPDLQRELENRDHVRVPAVVVSLYLKTLAQSHSDQLSEARSTVSQLQKEIESCKFEQYYHEGFGLENMQALSHSVNGYALLAVGCKAQALEAFRQALNIVPNYDAAQRNVDMLRKALKPAKKT